VLERQLGKQKARFTPSNRAFLAALLHRLAPGGDASAVAAGTHRTRSCAGTAI
jgi:hypothetical protein